MKKITSFFSRHAAAIVWFLPVLLLLYVYRSVLFYNSLFYGGDTLFSFYPYFEYFAKGGPVITQNILSGFPVLVSVTGIWFYPVNRLALLLFDPFDAYRFLSVANVFLTYVCTYVYARNIKYSHYPAIFAALVFTFSGQLLLWTETLTNTNYYFILPAVLVCIEHVRQKNRALLWTIVAGILLGMGWLSGHVQYIFYIHTFVAVYVLWWVYGTREVWKKALGYLVCMFGISAVVGWPQIQAILAWRSVSARSGGVPLSDFFLGAYMPQDMLRFVLPFWKHPLIPMSNPNLYLGILPLCFLIWAVVYIRRIDRAHVRFFAWTAAFCFVFSVNYSPVGFVVHYLPFFNSFREAPRIMYVGAFAAALLAAAGFEYYLSHREAFRINRLTCIFLYVAGGTALIGVMATTIVKYFFLDRIISAGEAYFFAHRYAQTSGMSREYYTAVLGRYVHQFFDSVSLPNYQVVVALAFVVVAVAVFRYSKRYSPQATAIIVIVSVVLNLGFVYKDRLIGVSKADFYAVPKTALFIQNDLKDANYPLRSYAILPGNTLFQENAIRCGTTSPRENFALQKELMLPNFNMQYGIDVVDGYDNFMPKTISRFLAYIGSEQSVTGDMLANEPIPIESRVAKMIERKNVLRALNIGYVVSHFAINDPDFVHSFSESIGACQTTLAIYKLKNAWPRYFLTSNAASIDQTKFEDVATALAEKGNIPIVYIDQIPEAVATSTQPAIPLSASYGHQTVSFNATTTKPTLLYNGNAWLPNWRAYIDGEETPILRANYAYMAIVIPAGHHEITFFYK